MEIMQSVKADKFDESVDISIKLGVDPNKSDQNVSHRKSACRDLVSQPI